MANQAGPSTYEQQDEPEEITDSPLVKAAREAAEKVVSDFLDSHTEEMRVGTDGDRRRIRLHADQAGNRKYEEELTKAIERTEADKEQLKDLLVAVQAETGRMLEELRELETESGQ